MTHMDNCVINGIESVETSPDSSLIREVVIMKKKFFVVIGVILIILGVIGLLLPVIPQVPFLAAGVASLSKGSEKFRKKMAENKMYQKYMSFYNKIRAGRGDSLKE